MADQDWSADGRFPSEDDLRELMEEIPGGPNEGRRARAEPPNAEGSTEKPWHGLGARRAITRDFLEGGWHVEPKQPTGFPPGAPRLDFTEEQHETAREHIGFSRAAFDAIAKRTSRRPLTETERIARAALAERVAAFFRDAGRARGATKLLEEAYCVNRMTLGRLREEGRRSLTKTI